MFTEEEGLLSRTQDAGEAEMFQRIGLLPTVDYAVTHLADTLTETQLRSEIYNDTSLTIADLTPLERQKLSFVAVPTVHITPHANTVVEALANADYVLLESVGLTEEQRLGLDMVDNLLLRGVELAMPDNSLATMEAQQLSPLADWRRAVITTIAARRLGNTPVFRIIDIASDDPEFSPEKMLPPSLSIAVDPKELYGTPVDKLADRVRQKLLLAGEGIRIREQEQLDDISTIAANAVRLHPEKPQITIGISMGASHSMVVRHLQAMGLPVEIHWGGTSAVMPHDVLKEGGSEYSFSLQDALLRKAAQRPKEIDQADVHCWIAFRLVWNAIRPPFELLGPAAFANDLPIYITDSLASAAVYALDAPQHSELLEHVDALHSRQGIPGLRGLRLGLAMGRINHTVLWYLDKTLGSFADFADDVMRELIQR